MAAPVSDSDVEGIELTASPGGVISGTYRFEDQMNAPDLSELGPRQPVMLTSTDPAQMPLYARPSFLGENRTFEMKSIHPGRYHVRFPTAPTYYVKSIVFLDQKLPDDLIEVPDGFTSGTMEVILSANPASVSGVVVNADKQPLERVTVMAVPEFKEKEDLRTDRIMTSPTDQMGGFLIQGLRPGRYGVIAFDQPVSGMTLRNRDFLAAQWEHMEKVSLDEKQTKNLTLEAKKVETQ